MPRLICDFGISKIVSENEIIAVEGLQPGDRVASAGVTFLREGQTVKLLSEGQ